MSSVAVVDLLEFITQLGPLKVDREAGVIHDVKVLGRISENGRTYTAEAIERAKGLYEGKATNANHPIKANDSRSAYDRMGWLEGPYSKPDGLYAKKWNILKAHPLAAAVMEAAERNPSLFGLSHAARGKERRDQNGQAVIEDIEEVMSVDLVADPATVAGLFEGKRTMKKTIKSVLEAFIAQPQCAHLSEDDKHKLMTDDAYMGMMGDPMDVPDTMSVDEAGISAMAQMVTAAAQAGDWKKALAVVKAFEKLLTAKEEETPPAGEGDEPPVDDNEPAEEAKKVKAQVDQATKALTEQVRLGKEEMKVRDLVEEAGLKFLKPETRKAFIASLIPLDEAGRKTLIEERREQKPAGGKPRSAPAGGQQHTYVGAKDKDGKPLTEGKLPTTGKEFAEYVTV